MAMFEREVKFIYDFSSSKVKKLGNTATYAELLPLDLHPAIMRYIAAEIEYRVFEDRQTLLKHSMFDYSGKEISKHFSKITDEIKREKKFSTDFISKIILHATSFNVNYLIRPNWSLKKLIFDTNDSKSVAEINQILNYTYFYKHIPKVTREYFEKKKLITMNKDEFGILLEKLDKASFDSYGKDLLEAALKSISSFFNIGSMKKSIVPLQAVGVYLQEKNLTNHLAELDEKLKGETKSKIELNDLKSILFQVPLESSETYDFPQVPSSEVEFEEQETIQPEEEITEPETDETFETLRKEQPEVEEPIDEIEEIDQPEEEIVEKDTIEIEDTPEDDVEIQLRSNKEKEVIETPEEEPDTKEAIEEDEHEEDESVEYLVDENEKRSDIILTSDDDPELEPEAIDDEVEDSQSDVEDEIPKDDYEEYIEQPEKEDESDLEIIKDEIQHFEELPDEPEEESSEELEEAESEVEDYDEYLGIDDDDDSDTEELIVEDEMEYEVNPDTADDYSYPEEEKEDEPIDEIENLDEEDTEENPEYLPEENEDEDIVNQATLFGDVPDENLIDEPEEEEKEKEDFIQDYDSQNKAKKIDIADLLENKNMTKIIAVVFDYDMEEFANAVEKVCESTTSQEAFTTLNEIFEMNDVNPSSKEAQAFREIIAEYFEQN